ncbi:MAG TPA: apolipoprotein N-acyltransferase [Rubrivivax sp.]|nr:apolipoprotein N-acyltransferase [Rubrivivax sp.]
MNPRGRWGGPLELALAPTLGALQTLAFVYTAAWPLPLLTLAWLAWRLQDPSTTPLRVALLGWLYGTAWLCTGVWWLYISMHVYGGLPAPLAAAAVFALCAALSLYLAAACAAFVRWRRGRGADAAFFSALWLLAELARGFIFTGFPWLASGYSQVDSPLNALAPWLGVYGIGAVLALAAAGLARVFTTRGRGFGPLAVAAGLAALAWALPRTFTQPAGELSVTLLQTNVSQDEKFSADRLPDVLGWLGRELMAAGSELVVTPETALPLLPEQLEQVAPGFWAALRQHFSWPERSALVGVPLGDYERGYTNSVIGMSAGPEYRYDKMHLVPFGEFIPTGFRWFTQMMNIPLGDFARGVANPPSFAIGRQRLAPNICYEDLFGEELARRFADAPAAPTMFINFSNIAWFGNTIAIDQHLHISRLRTLEFQRPMLRATNTGATAFIDHQGRVIASLEPYTRGTLRRSVQGRSGLTPFAAWASQLGLWPLLAAAVGTLAWQLRRRSAP